VKALVTPHPVRPPVVQVASALVELVPGTIERLAGTWTKKVTLLLVWPDAVTVTGWLPGVAPFAIANVAMIVLSLCDVIVAVIPKPVVIVGLAPNPDPVIVTVVWFPTGPWGGAILSMLGVTLVGAWPSYNNVSQGLG
jgi:hypothetical protein